MFDWYKRLKQREVEAEARENRLQALKEQQEERLKQRRIHAEVPNADWREIVVSLGERIKALEDKLEEL